MKKLLLAIFTFSCLWSTGQAQAYSNPRGDKSPWVTAWSAAPDSPGSPLSNKTIRQVIRTSIAGNKVRLRFSNLFGAAPITIASVHLARHESGSAIKPKTGRSITFGGKGTVTIEKGSDLLSDTVEFPVAALEELAVSIYLPEAIEYSTIHSTAIQTAYIAHGNVADKEIFPAGETDTSRFFLTDVEVETKNNSRAFVVMGDSITDGVGSTEDGNSRWPDKLAERLQSEHAFKSVAVVNSGISGNRILNDGAEPYLGPSELKRFDRDVLNKPGIRWVLVLSGGNDISAARVLGTSRDKVSARKIIEGMKTLIARARQKGVKIFGATLTPKGGAKWFYPEGERMRHEINNWIRTSKAFDGFVDFDKAIQDPSRPERMHPAYDSGDHVHPNDAGYKAMADAIDLAILRD
jgi:lysophospholipase L1-like esterase